MSKTVKVKTVRWEQFQGSLHAIFTGQDSMRRDISVAVPAGSLKVLSADSRRRLAAEKPGAQRSPMPSQWHQVNFLSAETMLLGTTDNQKVGLILDQDTDTEFALSFAPEDARELARRLMAEADNLPQSSKMN